MVPSPHPMPVGLAALLLTFVSLSAGAQPAEAGHPLFSIDCTPDAVEDAPARLAQVEDWQSDFETGDPGFRARWLYCRASALENVDRLEEARAAYTAAIETHREIGVPSADAVQALLGRAYIDYLQTNDTSRYCPDRMAALEMARLLDDPATLIVALNRAAFCHAGQGERLDEGLALLEEALALARAERLPAGELGMLYNATANLYRRNQLLEPAIDYLELAYQSWAEEDDRQDMFNMLHGLIQSNARLGRWADAEQALERMRELTERSPSFADFPFFIEFNAGTLAQARGDHVGAIRALDRALALEDTTRERYFVAAVHRMLALSRFQVGDIERATDHARTFLESGDVGRDDPEVLSAESILAYGEGRPQTAMQRLLDTLQAERAQSRERMQRNAAGQSALLDRRLEAFESEILRERLANRDLQLSQARQSERNARLFNALIGVTAAALLVLAGFLFWSRRRFRDHARTDALTGIANRRYSMQLAERRFAQSVSSDRPFALLLLDIDHFKQINDRYGHDVGDLAIRAVVGEVVAALPSNAIFGRLGGEEFMVALPDHAHPDALAVAERIRQKIADRPLDAGGIAVELTVSIGVAERSSATPRLDTLYRISDQALYAAKREGRDRIAAGTA